jgi:5-oxopent-3-ene-1,2,5-tricarboxylate decarboxylase / 2-hydroxyhepta-2,4-diene-1,7-dioate isomerase
MVATTTPYLPRGTVYGTLLNFSREQEVFAPQMQQAPYKAPPNAPVLYVKTANTFTANGGWVPVPAHLPQIEVGATLSMVFGPPGLENAAQTAPKLVATWVLMNDFSVPHASYFRPPVKFKCLDGFLGVGSQVVSSKALGDPSKVVLEVRINGALKQTVDISNLIRDAETLARDVAAYMTLREGDVLMLGLDCLPSGGRPLARAGDQVEISSPSHPSLGVLSNTLVPESA